MVFTHEFCDFFSEQLFYKIPSGDCFLKKLFLTFKNKFKVNEKHQINRGNPLKVNKKWNQNDANWQGSGVFIVKFKHIIFVYFAFYFLVLPRKYLLGNHSEVFCKTSQKFVTFKGKHLYQSLCVIQRDSGTGTPMNFTYSLKTDFYTSETSSCRSNTTSVLKIAFIRV